MSLKAKWFGVSFVLHLAAAGSLIFSASRFSEQTPQAVMVVLDTSVPTEVPLHKTVHIPPPLAAERASRPVPAEPAKPEIRHQLVQPPAQQLSAAIPPPEQARNSEQPTAAKAPAAAISLAKAEEAIPAPVSLEKSPVTHSSPAAEERSTREKEQQRYLKEHFAYIRELVTKRLVYPPVARRMNWSGRVLVAFVIAEDGTVHNIRVEKSSGFPILDKSATETVRKTAPFPKPPVRAEIVVPINFRMMP